MFKAPTKPVKMNPQRLLSEFLNAIENQADKAFEMYNVSGEYITNHDRVCLDVGFREAARIAAAEFEAVYLQYKKRYITKTLKWNP